MWSRLYWYLCPAEKELLTDPRLPQVCEFCRHCSCHPRLEQTLSYKYYILLAQREILAACTLTVELHGTLGDLNMAQ